MKCKGCGTEIWHLIKQEMICFDCYNKQARLVRGPRRIVCSSCAKLKETGSPCTRCRV